MSNAHQETDNSNVPLYVNLEHTLDFYQSKKMEEKTFFFLHSMISSEKVTILVTVFSIQSREKNNAYHIFIVHITNHSLFLNSQFFLSKIIFLYWVVFLLQYLPWLVYEFFSTIWLFLNSPLSNFSIPTQCYKHQGPSLLC